MIVAHIATVAFLGLEARAVEVQVQIASGLPKFVVVGLLNLSAERVCGTIIAGKSSTCHSQNLRLARQPGAYLNSRQRSARRSPIRSISALLRDPAKIEIEMENPA